MSFPMLVFNRINGRYLLLTVCSIDISIRKNIGDEYSVKLLDIQQEDILSGTVKNAPELLKKVKLE